MYFSLGTQRSVRPLSPASENKITEALRKMIEYYKYHGINLRTCYEDFDVHHIGKITESQVSHWCSTLCPNYFFGGHQNDVVNTKEQYTFMCFSGIQTLGCQ